MLPVYTSNIPNFLKTRLTQTVSNIYLRLTFNKMTHNAFHRTKNYYLCMDIIHIARFATRNDRLCERSFQSQHTSWRD